MLSFEKQQLDTVFIAGAYEYEISAPVSN